MRIAYTALFPLPPDRKSSISSIVVHSVDMNDMRPPTEANVPSATANVPFAVIDIPNDVENVQDKNASFWLKKCTKCPLFGHLRSTSHMCLENSNNAHRCV